MSAEAPRSPAASVLATVFVCGAAVLVVEVVGARVLAPYYGSGLYSWSALITVTLAALALGYAAGGRLADRYPRPSLLPVVVLLSGSLVLLVPWVAGPVLALTSPMEPRLGVLSAALLLFLPPLALLGSISPIAIRLSRPAEAELGSVSGLLFAVSTAGSLLAALATGFVLIPNVGVRAILSATGALLLALAALLVARRRPRSAVAALVVAGAIVALSSRERRYGERLEVVYREPSFYGLVRVVDKDDLRILTVDGIGQNYVSKSSGLGRGEGYVAFLGALPRLAGWHGGERALLVGLGAGDLVKRLTESGVTVDVAEIDARIVDAARRTFGLALPDERLHVMDGRLYLRRTRQRYDLIVLDAFVAEDPPSHLLTREAFALARERLTPAGLLALNYTSAAGSEDAAMIAATLRSALPNVRAVVDTSPMDLASHVYLASPAPLRLDAARLTPEQRDDLRAYLEDEVPARPALVLTDDYSPLASLRRGISGRWRRVMVEFLGPDRYFWRDF